MTRRVWAPYAALALACLLVALAAWRLAEGAAPGQAVPEDAAAGAGAGEPGRADGAPSADSDAADAGGATAEAAKADGPTSASELLGVLAAGPPPGKAEAVSAWTEAHGLEDAVRELIGAYREDSGAHLLAYGYLDLAGNAWGAVVARPGSWVDVAVAISSADDSRTTVTVTRMTAVAEGSGA